jgi:xylulose-5-phosphate/fructose-6-phosphate phosphoketolase
VNVIVAGKQPALDYLTMDAAIAHCTRGLGVWDWAGSEADGEAPDVVLGCAGDTPTLEAVAAAALLKHHLPQLRVRVVNVVDLMRLQSPSEHPHGLADSEFDALFTPDKPVIFATGSRTGAATTGTSMSAATRRRAPPRRRSTW